METGRFKDWEFDRQIGEGRFGKVWMIHRKSPCGDEEEYAALKIVRISPTDEEISSCPALGMTRDDLAEIYRQKLQNSIQEIEIMHSLQGETNIVNYQDYELRQMEGEIGWEMCIRMELLKPLRTFISENGLSMETIADIGRSIATALFLCHHPSKGAPIIHGDVKPGNIYYSRPHCFKLGDFGLSFITNNDAGFGDGGTRAYLAPECISGALRTEKSDQYALGMVLKELLDKLGHAHTTKTDSEMVALQRAQMEQILGIATAQNPDERYGDIDDMRIALEGLGILNANSIPISDIADGAGASSNTKTDMHQKVIPDGDKLSGLESERAMRQTNDASNESNSERRVADIYLYQVEEQRKQQKGKVRKRLALVFGIVVVIVALILAVVCFRPGSNVGLGIGNGGKPILGTLNEYMTNPGTGSSVNIQDICDYYENDGYHGEYAVAFGIYANVLCLLEKGDYDGAKEEAIVLQYNASFSGFRTYLKSDEFAALGFYAIGPVDDLMNYVEARRLEALGDLKQASLYYDKCQQFMDAYDRKKALRQMEEW